MYDVDYNINSEWSVLRSTIGDNGIAMKYKEEYDIFFERITHLLAE